MSRIVASAFLGAVLLISTAAEPQAPTRVRGTISAVAGDAISVKSLDGKNVEVRITEKTTIVFAQPMSISEIKPGDFLAVTSVKRTDGTLTAYDVRRFPKPVNPGHRPFDGGDNQTMTNATLSAMVNATKGHELALSYDGGSQKVVVADTASITSLVPGTPAQLVPGSYVSLLADAGGEGKLSARNVEVRKDAPKAPQ